MRRKKRTRVPSPQQIKVLEALLGPKPRYGYDLMKETRLGPGTMYGLLKRLHDEGYLARSTELVEGRARARYLLTDAGRHYAERALIEEEYERAVRSAARDASTQETPP